jgi:hypothetical protein
MLYTLKQLHQNGIALSPDELAASPSYTGNLVVQDWEQGSSFGRFIRQAKLLGTDHPTVNPGLLLPLFEPVLVKMTDKQMTLHGYQIHVGEDRTVMHFAQYWVLRATEV